jgi:hypothetical protein
MSAGQTAEEIIDAHILDLVDLFGLEQEKGGKTSLPQRQILDVRQTLYYAAGYTPSTGQAPASQAYVKLTGSPSPNSQVTNGVIRFAPRAALRAPSYHTANTAIQVWVDQDLMVQTLEQLRHATRYLWIGWFANGHVYADLHTSP